MEELKSVNGLYLFATICIGLFGMFIHYYKKWLRGQTKDSIRQYMFGDTTWKYTMNAILVVVGTIGGMYISGALEIKTLAGLIGVFTIGYTFDSMLNKDSEMVSSVSPSVPVIPEEDKTT